MPAHVMVGNAFSASKTFPFEAKSNLFYHSFQVDDKPQSELGEMANQLASPEGRSEDESDEEHQKTIYRGILSAQIKLVKSFSLMTSVIGLGCQPLIYLKVKTNFTYLCTLVNISG